ncbi:F0F1 ATP synthase subunit B [Tissierella sp. Yu-01]|uniref:F0F1 ATP synthase subunit B n=1 Tax=Tissierella sp. Yu-01 TaxID=3035694 RepID=UPI00240E90E9|nr:F0F1 ATP synthase subunit B [Tissierella sp. Yu-01]WFA08156.1 F0F1 ATP synthase subunit B [Tissierella sp. Yu-01]
MGDYQVLVIPELKSMIITAITLVILYVVYKKFLYVPVNMYLQERRNLIQSEINDAKSLKEQAIAIKQEQEAYISEAQRQAQEIIENSRKFGEEMKENILLEAKKEAREIIVKAQKEVEKQKKDALEEIKLQSVDIAVLIASKIMEEQISVDKQNYLIDKFIDEVGTSEWLS